MQTHFRHTLHKTRISLWKKRLRKQFSTYHFSNSILNTFASSYRDNPGLSRGDKHKTRHKVILGTSVGVLAALFILFLGSLVLLRYLRKKTSPKTDDKGMYKELLLLLYKLWGSVFCISVLFCTLGDSLRTNTKRSTGYSIARGGSLMDEGIAYYIPLNEIEEATNSFSTKIGQGSFGPVYYGKMKDGKEIAVKIMADSSSHATKQFVTEVIANTAWFI